MSPSSSSLAIKALFLGFFCCLGLSADQGPANEEPAQEFQRFFALTKVHPDTDRLASAVSAGTEIAPPGYFLLQLQVLDDEGQKKVGEKPILLSRRNIIGASSVELARATTRPSEIMIRLTEDGGARVRNATRKMVLGKDRIAVVYKDSCIIAPTVQAILSRDFVITGLGNKKEVETVVKALNAAKK